MKSLTLRTLDAKAARLCKLRAGGRCERCGSTRDLEWSHYQRRSKGLLLRWDMQNADCLCARCHAEIGDSPGSYKVWRFHKKRVATVYAEVRSGERIPTTKTLWMQQENERLDAALREMAA